MKHHVLKLNLEYAILKINGIKPFEIRKNDRNYHVGDFITYIVPESPFMSDLIKCLTFHIEYITDFEQKDGYIVWSEKLVSRNSI